MNPLISRCTCSKNWSFGQNLKRGNRMVRTVVKRWSSSFEQREFIDRGWGPLEEPMYTELPIMGKRNLHRVDKYNRFLETPQTWVTNFNEIEETKLALIDLHPDVFRTFPRLDTAPRNLALCCSDLEGFNILPVYGLNCYSMLKHDTLVLTVKALEEIESRLLNCLHSCKGSVSPYRYKDYKDIILEESAEEGEDSIEENPPFV